MQLKYRHFAWECIDTKKAVRSLEFAPEIEGMGAVFENGGTAVAHAQPEDRDLCIVETHCFPVTISAPERHIETA